MATTYNNIGSIYNSLKKEDIAKLYFDTTLLIAKRFEDYYSEADALGNIANYYYKKRNYPLAEEFCRKAYDIKLKLEDDYGSATSASDMSAILMEQKKTDIALKYLFEGEKIALNHNFIDLLLPIYRNYSQAYEIKGDYKKSIYYLNKAFEIKDTILMEGKIREAATKEKEYNFNLLQIKDSLKNENQKIQTKLLHDKEIYKQKTYSYIGIVGFVIMLIIALIVFKAFQEKKKSNIIISSQKVEVEKQKHIIEEHQKEILDSIHYAKRIQYTLLAHEDFVNENIKQNFILFKPKDIVSGDFYWATKHEDKFYIAVCDSTGHGVPGAFMSLLNIGFLTEAINEKNILEPHKVLNFVRERLINSISKEGQKDGFDGILVCIDKTKNKITYAAANNAPILISNNEIIELEKDRMPVGKGERTEEFKLYTIDMKPNDTLYLYTDGYADQFGGPKGKKFKYKALNELLLAISSDNMISQKEKLNSTIENWKGDLEQVDDICVVGLLL